MEELITSVSELRYALDTFYLLISGVLVMWMAAGFAMLEAGLVRAKNTTEILTKNILLYAIACVMYLLVGYNIMYVDNGAGGWLPSVGSLMGSQADDAAHSCTPTSSSRWSSSPPPPPSSRGRWPSG